MKLEYLKRIETLEEKVQKYDEEYEQFMMFFKNKILENLHEIQNKIEESEVVEKLKMDILSLQNDIDEKKKLMNVTCVVKYLREKHLWKGM